jgi:hypothetical protein
MILNSLVTQGIISKASATQSALKAIPMTLDQIFATNVGKGSELVRLASLISQCGVKTIFISS